MSRPGRPRQASPPPQVIELSRVWRTSAVAGSTAPTASRAKHRNGCHCRLHRILSIFAGSFGRGCTDGETSTEFCQYFLDHLDGAAQTEGPAQASVNIFWIIWPGLHRRRDQHRILSIFSGSFGRGCTDGGTSTNFCQYFLDHLDVAAQMMGPAQIYVNI